MNSVIFLGLRRMRAPLLVLIAVYAISITGLVLIPGVDGEGKPGRMSFFHAFYFMSYTASTIGFGELPNAFTDAQRMWVTVSIYLSVIGWSYSILKLIALMQDQGFLHAVETARFARRVHGLADPFYLICGYGETGRLVARALDRMGLRFVAIDRDPARIDELDLEDLNADAPALTADAASPETLVLAGLRHRRCLGVIALTDDDRANLAVAMSARLLNPGVTVLARAAAEQTAVNMASFGTDHIINPFRTFGDYVALALRSPGSQRLLVWLTGVPGTHLGAEAAPPRGRWVVAGYGRFGRAMVQTLEAQGIEVTVIEPRPEPDADREIVVGEGVAAAKLDAAGIRSAAGIVAGTDNDVNNLSIAVTARELNPNLFVVVRQNQRRNRLLFEAFPADLTMIPSEIIAHQCLARLTTPLLQRFLEEVKRRDDAWADSVIERLRERVGDRVPLVWGVTLNAADAPALHRMAVIDGASLDLEVLLRDPSDRERTLPCLPLMLVRDGSETVLPDPDIALRAGDRILFAGRSSARSAQTLACVNAKMAEYVRTGCMPTGSLWQALGRLRAGATPS